MPNNKIRIPLWGVVKENKTFLFRDKACTMSFGFFKAKSKKSRTIMFLDKEYDLIIAK